MSDHRHAPWLPEPNVPPAPRGDSMTFGYLDVVDVLDVSIINPQRGQDIVVDDRGSSIRFAAPAQRTYEPLAYIMGQAAARGKKISGVIWFEDETHAEHPMPVFDPPATIANEQRTTSTNSFSYGTRPPTYPGPVHQAVPNPPRGWAVQQQDVPSPPTQQATPDVPPRQQDPPATIANEQHTTSTNSFSYGTRPPTNPGPVHQAVPNPPRGWAVQQQDVPSPPTQQATPDVPPRQPDPPSLPEPQAGLDSPPGQTVLQGDWPSLPPRPSTAESSSKQTQKKPAPPQQESRAQIPAPTLKRRVGKHRFVGFPGPVGGTVREVSVDESDGSSAGTFVIQPQSSPRICDETSAASTSAASTSAATTSAASTSAATTASEKQTWQTVEKKKKPNVIPHPFNDKELLRHNQTKKCANCRKKGHIALDCVVPVSRGCINLCVWCNKNDHAFDDCKNPSKPTDKERLFHILVVRRANKCPVETRQSWWDLCVEASRINDPSSNTKNLGKQFRSLCESNVGFPWRAVVANRTFLAEIDEYDYVEDIKRRASTLPVVDAYTHDADLLLTRHALAYERVGGVEAYAAFAKTRDNVPCTSPIPEKFIIRFGSFVWEDMEDEVDKVFNVDKTDKVDKVTTDKTDNVDTIDKTDNADSESRHSMSDRPVLVSGPFPLQNPFRALQDDSGQRAHDDEDDDDAVSYSESEIAGTCSWMRAATWADEVEDARGSMWE